MLLTDANVNYLLPELGDGPPRPSGGSRVVGDIMLGLIFLALAVQNSIRLLRQKSEDRHQPPHFREALIGTFGGPGYSGVLAPL